MSDVKKIISDYLGAVGEISIATVDGEGKAWCAVVAQVNESGCLYFATDSSTHKVKNLLQNPSVAFTANKPGGNWKSIQSVQMQGIAAPVTDGAEINRVMGMMLEKFPPMKEIPPMPGFVLVKVRFTRGYYLDYAKGFGFREEAVY